MSADADRPNACNLCHVDRSLAWADEWLSEWYGQPRVELSADESSVPAAALWLLEGDAVQRATAAWHLGWEPAREAAVGDWRVRLLARSLDDPYAAVRYVSERSLRKFTGFGEFEYDFVRPSPDQASAVETALGIARTQSTAVDAVLGSASIDRLRSARTDPPITVLE